MKLTKVELDKSKILSISEDEYTLFLIFGHLMNEINASSKLLYWAASAPIDNKVKEEGQFSMMMMLLQFLAGKLREGWQLLQQTYYGTQLSKQYHPMLDDATRESLDNLERYFGRTNSAHIIRNNFSFHYSPEQVSSVLPQIKDDLNAYMNAEAAPNILFSFSETIMAEALISLLAEMGIKTTFSELAGEMIELASWFAQAADGIMYSIIESNKNDLLRSDPEIVELDNLLDFSEVYIPWFTSTEGGRATAPTTATG